MMEESGGGDEGRRVDSGEFQQHSDQIAVPTRFSFCSPCPRLRCLMSSNDIKRLDDRLSHYGSKETHKASVKLKEIMGLFFFFPNQLQINLSGILPGAMGGVLPCTKTQS